MAPGEWEEVPVGQDDEWEEVAPESGGMLSSIGRGLVKAANTIDSYTGAPVRSGVMALQEGKGISGAASAYAEQFGEDNSTAPHFSDIRKKAGVDFGDNPISFGLTQTNISPNDIADFAGETALDPTMFLPVGKIAKGVGKAAGAALEGGSRLASSALRRSEDVAGAIAKRGLIQRGFGVPQDAVDSYLKNHERLKDVVSAKDEIGALKREMDSTLEPLATRVDESKDVLRSAKDARSEELMRLTDQQREAREALRLAQEQRLGEASAGLAGDVQGLNKEVSAGSAKAFDILDAEKVRVPLGQLKKDLSGGIKALEARAVTDEQVAAVETLKRYAERLDKFGDSIPGGEAKRILQSMDRELKHLAPGEVSRLGREDQLLGILRRRIDEPLKASPAYAKQMEGVAKDTRLLKSAEDMATESGAARGLQASQRVTGADRAAIIRAIGERRGVDYLAQIERASIPEYQRAVGLAQRLRAARKGPGVKAAQAELEAASAELAPFKQIAPSARGSNAQAIIENQIRPGGGKIDYSDLIGDLDKKFGKGFAQKIDDIKTIAAFDKDFTRGSANTNFWAILAGSLGTLAGGLPGGVAGGALGGAFGRMAVDRFGPQMARQLLDHAPLLQKMRPSEWVKSLKVPDSVKDELMQELVAGYIEAGSKSAAAASKPFLESGAARQVADDNESQSDRVKRSISSKGKR